MRIMRESANCPGLPIDKISNIDRIVTIFITLVVTPLFEIDRVEIVIQLH